MEIALIFKIAAVGILVTILSQILKHSGREEHAFLLSLAGLILVLSWIIPYIYDLFVSVQNLFELWRPAAAGKGGCGLQTEVEMDVAKAALLGVAGVLTGLLFKSGRQEYGALIGIGVSLLIFARVSAYLGQMKDALSSFSRAFDENGEYLGILFKVVGITWLSEFSSGLCRDAGYQSIASQVELFGKTAVLLAGMPVILSLIETISGFMG